MIVTVSGEIGSGKSTVARALAQALGLRYLSTGQVFREEARRRHVTLAELGRLAEQDPSIDRTIDEMQVQAARAGNILVESRLSGWLIDGDLRIWLRAPLEVRASRVAARDGGDLATAARDVQAREACEHQRYRQTYRLDLSDLTRYHVIVDTAMWGADEVVAALLVLARAVFARRGSAPEMAPVTTNGPRRLALGIGFWCLAPGTSMLRRFSISRPPADDRSISAALSPRLGYDRTTVSVRGADAERPGAPWEHRRDRQKARLGYQF
jgi:cytidylate kinase